VSRRPWHGVLVANPMFFTADLELDLDAYVDHIGWLAQGGCQGITPNGSLGEYQTLTEAERRRVVEVAVEAAPEGFVAIPGVGAYGARESVRLTEHAAVAGAPAVMALPPNAYRADRGSVVAHYRAIAAVGLPVVAYNNPFDTKVDLSPDLLAELAGEGLIVAVKEFAGDPRRAYMIKEASPDLDILIGSDDTVLEVAVAGASGWVSGYTNAFPRSCVALYEASIAGDLASALPLYRALHPLLRWDSKPEFVQAIKLSMDVVGRHGGPCRPPRGRLDDDAATLIRTLTEKAVAAGFE
jgi:dihydrodipicolinate synthase/N-acetylneuraminate lyase